MVQRVRARHAEAPSVWLRRRMVAARLLPSTVVLHEWLAAMDVDIDETTTRPWEPPLADAAGGELAPLEAEKEPPLADAAGGEPQPTAEEEQDDNKNIGEELEQEWTGMDCEAAKGQADDTTGAAEGRVVAVLSRR